MTAGTNNTLNDAIGRANSWANGSGIALTDGQSSAGSTGLGALAPYMARASQLSQQGLDSGLSGILSQFANGSTSASGPTAALSQALNDSAVNGASGASNAQNTLSNVSKQAMSDPTERLAANAGTYMNSSPVNEAIAANNATIDQALNQTTLPGINRQAAQGGALNSSRAGAAAAMAQGQAATAKATQAAALQNNAYNQGLSTALSAYNNGLGTAASAAGTQGSLGNASALGTAGLQQNNSQYNTSNQLNAASGLLGLQQQNVNSQLSANSQLGTAAALGNTATNSAMQNALANYQLQAGAGQQQQSNDQNALTNAYQQWQNQNGYQTGILNNYLGLVSGNYGSNSTGTSTTKQSGSLGNTLLGGALGLGGLLTKYI
ncbi:hypothetical protein [Asaia prunellae]|uniref:hypothetical protein n=1 Tax=Asaia prunellae TaxID=610245 RepID=UPI00046FEF4E|nr:hypothetical protein [Asaia prunellae]